MNTKVNIEFEIQMIQEQCDEMITCYIPEIDCHFSARTINEVTTIGKKMIMEILKIGINKIK